MKIGYIVVWWLVIFTSCVNKDLIFIDNKEAQMPILIKGNKSSGVFVVFLHGGPGNGTYIWEDFFGQLEKQYAVVFWNQRAAGESQGNVHPSQMTIAQFVEDTHKVIQLIDYRFHPRRIFLMGHSWGGLLGTAYLIQYQNDPVSGWIEVDGAHNKVLGEQYSRQWVIDYANEQIQENQNAGYWSEALDWYDHYTGRLTYTSRHYSEYLPKAHAYFYGPEVRWYSVTDFFFGRPNGFDLILSGTFSDRQMESEISVTDLTPVMAGIRIPSLLLWGRHDGAIPWQMAQDAYDALGTLPQDKKIVYFENSAHSPMIEENEAFSESVISFIDQYR